MVIMQKAILASKNKCKGCNKKETPVTGITVTALNIF